jgi:hypothetical protein
VQYLSDGSLRTLLVHEVAHALLDAQGAPNGEEQPNRLMRKWGFEEAALRREVEGISSPTLPSFAESGHRFGP